MNHFLFTQSSLSLQQWVRTTMTHCWSMFSCGMLQNWTGSSWIQSRSEDLRPENQTFHLVGWSICDKQSWIILEKSRWQFYWYNQLEGKRERGMSKSSRRLFQNLDLLVLPAGPVCLPAALLCRFWTDVCEILAVVEQNLILFNSALFVSHQFTTSSQGFTDKSVHANPMIHNQ